MRKKLILAVLLTSVLFFHSCGERGIIPKDVMAQIYYDMYMNDQAIKSKYIYRRMSDTLHVYTPIFEKYGYTEEDYRRSVEHYLLNPEKFEKIFKRTLQDLEKRKNLLDALIAAEEKRALRWDFIDSLEYYTADTIQSSAYYRALRMLFFKPDTLVPNSPVIDSIFMERPQNIYTIFNDSIYNSDRHFAFYKNLGIFPALPPKDTTDSLVAMVEKIEKMEEKPEKKADEAKPEKKPKTKDKATPANKQLEKDVRGNIKNNPKNKDKDPRAGKNLKGDKNNPKGIKKQAPDVNKSTNRQIKPSQIAPGNKNKATNNPKQNKSENKGILKKKAEKQQQNKENKEK